MPSSDSKNQNDVEAYDFVMKVMCVAGFSEKFLSEEQRIIAAMSIRSLAEILSCCWESRQQDVPSDLVPTESYPPQTIGARALDPQQKPEAVTWLMKLGKMTPILSVLVTDEEFDTLCSSLNKTAEMISTFLNRHS